MAEIIVALDLPSATEALRLLERLREARWVKVGSILMTREGPPLVRALVGRGFQVFLDLKWHDIPNTVADAVAAARDAGVSLATVHTLGGEAMMVAAARAADGAVALVGVTVLTSHSAAGYAEAVGRSGVELGAEVDPAGAISGAAGLQGVVCSPHEVALVRRCAARRCLVVVPGHPPGRGGCGRPGPGRRRAEAAAGRRHPPGGRAPGAPGRRPRGRAARASGGGRSASSS